MKIKFTNTFFRQRKELLKFIMRTFIFLLCSTAFGFNSSDIFSQNTKIHIDKDQVVSIDAVFDLLRNQTDYTFIYEENLFKDTPKVQLRKGIIRANKLLETCFSGKDFKLNVKNNKIVIIATESTSIDQQTFTVSGSVLDTDGQPLTGANIIEKGTTNGTQADFDGNFSISVANETAVLVVSYLGFASKEVNINGQTTITINLVESTSGLEEVVVTALGIRRQKKSLTYATQSVESSELTGVRDANNLINSFQGKIANAQITQSAGGVGSDSEIILRGSRSLSGSNSALIVVDGVPNIDNNSTSNINPDDIESVSVLPGASAGVLYGSQAGNGAIIITTKKGTKGGDVSVNVNSSLVVESPFALPMVQNIYGQGSAGVLNPASGESWGAKMEGQEYVNYLGESRQYSAQPNNIEDFFSNGISSTNSISVSGGLEKAQTFLSYTKKDIQGIIPTNNLTSHNFNFRISNKIGNRITIDSKVSYLTQIIDNKTRAGEANNTPVMNIYQIPRNVSDADARNYQTLDNVGVYMPTAWPSTLASNYQNPYWITNRDILEGKKDQLSGFISAKYDVTDWLSVTGRANLSKSLEEEKQMTSVGTVLFARNKGGYYRESAITGIQKWFDLILQGNNKISNDFSVDYSVGAIYQDRQFGVKNDIADGLNVANKFSLNFATNPQFNSTQTQIQTQSVFGDVNLSFKDNAITLNGSFRNDWDSRLPTPHSYQYYSTGLSGVLSDLIELPESMSFLKAYVTYAEVGNGGQFGLLSSSYNYSQGAGNGYLSRSSVLPFPDLKPEIVKNWEAGLQSRFFNNRAGVSLAYYKSNAINQLIRISLPVATGFSQRYINAGDIQNEGLELVLNGFPIFSEDFSWEIDLNFSFNGSKVNSLTDDLDTIYLGSFGNFGAVPQAKIGGSYNDLIADQWQTDANGNFIVTADGLPFITSQSGLDPEVIGNANPDKIFGLTNTFKYKDFSLRMLVDGKFGGVMVSNTEQNLSFSGITEATANYREGGWNLGGVDLDGNPVSATISSQQFWQTVSGKRSGVGEFFAYDASNVRLREVSLGYDIPLPSNLFIKKASFSLIARNLFWIYRGSSLLNIPGLEERKMWFDPDMGKYADGTEYGAIPSTQSFGFNLNLIF